MYKPLLPHRDVFKVAAESNLNVGVTVRADRLDNPGPDATHYNQPFRSGANDRPTPLGTQQQRIAAADSATSLLERERELRGDSVEAAARKIGITTERFRELESLTAFGVNGWEKTRLRAYAPGLSAEALLSPNTPENRAKCAGRF